MRLHPRLPGFRANEPWEDEATRGSRDDSEKPEPRPQAVKGPPQPNAAWGLRQPPRHGDPRRARPMEERLRMRKEPKARHEACAVDLETDGGNGEGCNGSVDDSRRKAQSLRRI